MDKQKLATVVLQGIKHTLELMTGVVTPDVFLLFQMACAHHFANFKVDDTDKVTMIRSAFKNPFIANWFLTNQAHLQALSVNEFYKELKKCWFKNNWADALKVEIICFYQTDAVDFNS